jgi:hypothetical protein
VWVLVDCGSSWRRWEVAEVGSGGKERTVGVNPGTRRTRSLELLCMFCEPVSKSVW